MSQELSSLVVETRKCGVRKLGKTLVIQIESISLGLGHRLHLLLIKCHRPLRLFSARPKLQITKFLKAFAADVIPRLGLANPGLETELLEFEGLGGPTGCVLHLTPRLLRGFRI